MNFIETSQQQYSQVAENILDVFADIASCVEAARSDQPHIDATTLTKNTLNNPGVFRTAAHLNAVREHTYQVLAEKPAIARIAPGHSNDEPTSVLLERTKGEREGIQINSRRSKRT